MNDNNDTSPDNLPLFANDIVSAYVSNNNVPVTELPALIASVYAALTGLRQGAGSDAAAEPEVAKPTPAQIRKSIRPDALISFIDGKPYKTLKRHLTGHGLTPDSYRVQFGLPSDYPMVAPSYSAQRSALAKNLGLGNRPKAAVKAASMSEAVTEPPKKRGRKKAA